MEIWAYFKSYFRPLIRVKLRTRFDETKADELTEEVLKAVIEKLEQGEPKDTSRLESYVVEMCDIMARETIRELRHSAGARPPVGLLSSLPLFG